MKKIFLFIFFSMTSKVFAYDAIVIVLEAPLLKEPKMSAVVLQTLRKGSRVFVPTEVVHEGTLPDFIQTYDRVGNIAYVPSRYIKLITNDLTEYKTSISPVHDPTDYRLEEPIPSTYPFDNTSFVRASFGLSIAPNASSAFQYGNTYHQQDFTPETGLQLKVTKKMTFDKYDRYYFGFTAAILSSGITINFDNGNRSKENRSIIKLGPLITYDAYKTHRHRLTLGTGFSYNYLKSSITVTDTQSNTEERLFSGFSLSPFATMLVQMTDVFPNIDFIAGADFNLNLASTQKSSDAITLPQLWGSDTTDHIQSGIKPQAIFHLGVQVRY